MNLPKLFSRSSQQQAPITVVSGLPRSGTSMMMKILQAGGMPVLTDDIRTADEDNPKGYFELERVKKVKEGDVDWLKDAPGRVVKIISMLLDGLPEQYRYKIIFMRRELSEILASQRQMLIRRNEDPNKIDDARLTEMYQEHLKRTRIWLANQSNMDVLYINYNDLMDDPMSYIEQVYSFVGGELDLKEMQNVPDQSLYRQRSSESG